MSSTEPTKPALRGVQITQEATPKSPFASPDVGSPFTASPSASFGNTAPAAATPSPNNRNKDSTSGTPLQMGPDGSPGPEINPLTGSPSELSATATRQVSWNISKNTVREYEISETQPSEDDWEDRQFRNCLPCCSIQ
jgi:hypothetical protein